MVGRAYLDRYGELFGLRNAARELREEETVPLGGGGALVRFRQLIGGVPVLGGELVVSLDPSGNLLAVNGETAPRARAVDVSFSAADAREVALRQTQRTHGVIRSELSASQPELWMYDPSLIGATGLLGSRIVWRVEVTSTPNAVREMVLVDATSGRVLLHFNQIAHARQRLVCDNKNRRTNYYECWAPRAARKEGDPRSPKRDVNQAYVNAGETWAFYKRYLDVDLTRLIGSRSSEDRGKRLRSTVRFCFPPTDLPCPYPNAFWDGNQMVYGAGFARADDVVAHEMTHGVTEHTSNLFYYYQSGAINESMSDIFGEFVDLTDDRGDDRKKVAWQLGEDLTAIGTIRDMQKPGRFGQPAKMTSADYTADRRFRDNGGVHTNSGVGNKAAYLIAAGDSFNGYDIKGIGIKRAARIYWGAERMLTSGSDYADLYDVLRQSCANLVAGTGIRSKHCKTVTKAVRATEMDKQPKASAAAPDVPVCPAGEKATNVYLNDMESRSGFTLTKDPENRFGFVSDYATSGEWALWGADTAFAGGDAYATMSQPVAVPAGSAPYLRFSHAYDLDTDSDLYHDGPPLTRGFVQYSVDGGPFTDAQPLFMDDSGYAVDNGFTRWSNGYRSARLDLSSAAGQSIKFRFNLRAAQPTSGRHKYGSLLGWLIDDLALYTCG